MIYNVPAVKCGDLKPANRAHRRAMAKSASAPAAALPRVAICIPSATTWHADTAMALASLTNRCAGHVGLVLMNEKSSMITAARNNLAQRALDFGAEWIFWLDSDMVFPPDALIRLLSHTRGIVGATYNKRVPPYETLGKLIGEPRSHGVVEAEKMPGGCMLIKADVYRSIGWPYYFETYDCDQQKITGEDINFCLRARTCGYKIWCDIDLTKQMVHIGENPVTCEARE